MRAVSNLFGRALRETGQALDRLGLVVQDNEIFRETFARHRTVMNLFDKVSHIIDVNILFNIYYVFNYFILIFSDL